jgi:hypothetical protein
MRPNLTRRFLALLLCAAVLLPIEFLFSWGDEGHMLINGVAARHVPKSMPQFFRTASARARLEYLGPEPDRWHSKTEYELKYAAEPDHFLDLERVAGMPLPADRYQFYRKLEEKRAAAAAAGAKPADVELLLPEHVGLQPYIAMEIYGRLKVAFREYRRLQREKKPTLPAEQNAVYYAGWLGHYVADASQPLHSTVHYNGWTGPNPNGYTTSKKMHWNFEGAFVKTHLKDVQDIGTLVKAPVKLEHPFDDYMAYLRESNGQVEKLYQLEKAGAFKDAGTPEGLAFVRARMAAGAQMLVNLWYTAWVESEVVPPDPFAEPASPAATGANGSKPVSKAAGTATAPKTPAKKAAPMKPENPGPPPK